MQVRHGAADWQSNAVKLLIKDTPKERDKWLGPKSILQRLHCYFSYNRTSKDIQDKNFKQKYS